MKKTLFPMKLLFVATVVAMILWVLVPAATPLQAQATNFSLYGYEASSTGGPSPHLKYGWTGGNLGNLWEEGEWVPYQLTVTSIQTSYPNFANFPDLMLSYDFYDSGKNAVFVDMIRGVQIGTTILDNAHGFPTAGGGGQPTTFAGVEAGQNDPNAHEFSGFHFINLDAPTQINRNLDGSTDVPPGQARHMLIIKATDITSELTAHGIPLTTNTISIYYQAHESRTFVWQNKLQSQYAVNPTTASWGGYLWGLGGWPNDVANGSGSYPGSSGHMHSETSGIGSMDVPIPIPPPPNGMISGTKYLDNPPIHDLTGDSVLSGWRIYIHTTLPSEPITLDTSVLTDTNGAYSFTGLTFGTYIISEASQREGPPAQTGYIQTYPWSGSGLPDQIPISNPDQGPYGYQEVLTSTTPTATGKNFGNFQPQPGLTITKTGDTISKVGDEVAYTFVITNTGNIALDRESVTDTVLGDITAAFPASLAEGASATINLARVVQAGDPDPLVNIVTATYTVPVLGTEVIASDDHSVDLLHPGLEVTKEADNTITKIDDSVHFTITVENTGDVDLNLVSFDDTLMGDISSHFSAVLHAGDKESWGYDHVTQVSDPDPLSNTAVAHYSITGLPNDITDSDTVDVDLVYPDMTLTKAADPTSGHVGDTITYTMVITNTGDVQLNRISVNDTVMGDLTSDFPATLAAGESVTVTETRQIQPTDPDPLVNVVTAVYQVNGLPNQLTREAQASVEILHDVFRKEFTNPRVWYQGNWISLAQWHILNGGTGDETWVPLFTKVKWTVTYYVPNNTGNTMYDAVLRDRFGAELNQANPGSYVASQGWVFFSYSTGAMRQLRITWYIGNLPNGVTATLSFDVVTKLNPALKQEYTSAGLKILNSGAVLKWRDAAGVQHSMSTPPCYVMAGNTFGAVVGVVTDGSGNPVSGASVVLWNGAIFVGIDATDQHGFYYFPKVTPGDYQVQYSSTTENVTISGGEIETVNFGT